MPTTYNGVGTHYYGRKNRQSRQAVCQQCGRSAELTSYETRLWFVFLYIPLVPLRRKHISDQCAVCSRHYVANVTDWETARQAETSAAMDRFRKEPTAEQALVVHGTLIGYQQHAEAAQFRDAMLERFGDSAVLRAGLASHLEACGLPEPAQQLWDAAFERDPELPEVRVGVGCRLMRTGKLADARQLLSFLEDVGAEKQFRLEPLFELASRYQLAGKHPDALEIYAVLLKAYPDIASDHQFRQMVLKSEKIVRPDQPMLPGVQHSFSKLFSRQYSSGHRWAVGLAVVTVLVVIGLAINNEYIRRHRTLTVINATGVDASIQVDDRPPFTVSGQHDLSVTEGTHTVTVSGPVQETHAVVVQSGYWQRWTNSPAWIVNVGGEAIIADVRVHYAVNPQPPTVHLLTDPVISRPHVDYCFSQPPDSLQIGSERSVLTKSVISWLDTGVGEDASVGAVLTLNEYDKAQAWLWAERRLTRDPTDEGLLRGLEFISDDSHTDRLRALLESKLDYRPVAVRWHRTYQDLEAVMRAYDDTIARYDQMLQTDPQNARLMYLRGRFEHVPSVSLDWTRKSHQADPEFAWPIFSLGYQDLSRGHWKAALQQFDEAVKLGFAEDDVVSQRHEALLALGQWDDLEQIHRKTLTESPASLQAAALLAEVLVAAGRSDEIEPMIAAAASAYRQQTNGKYTERIDSVTALARYYQGDLAGFVQTAAGVKDLKPLRLMALIEQGELTEVISACESEPQFSERWVPLLLAIQFFLQRDTSQTNAWYDRALATFDKLGPKFHAVATVLNHDRVTDEVIRQVLPLTESPQEKAILLTGLGVRATSDKLRQQCFQQAARFLIRRHPPYGLLKKVAAQSNAAP